MKTIRILRSAIRLPAWFVAALLVAAPLHADGPVGHSSLPGGAEFATTDNGFGETWGRAGGVDWSFYNFDLSRFESLTWGPVDTVSVGIALDGAIDEAGETLSFSSAIGNQAIWTGSTSVLVNDPVQGLVERPVATRMIMTVTSGGGPLALQASTLNGLPFVDVIGAMGEFVVNVKMQAKLIQPPGQWMGALDLFDGLNTTGDGLAITSFNNGFFFELAGGGTGELSLSEHDANLVSRTDQILGDLEFLTIESVNRLTDLGADADTLESLVRGLSNNQVAELLDRTGTLDQLLRELTALHGGNTGGLGADEVAQIVANSRDELVEIIVFLWGLSPGGEEFPDPDTIPQISELSTQASLDALAESLASLLADQDATLADQSGTLANIVQQLDDLRGGLDAIEAMGKVELEVIVPKRKSKQGRRLLVLVKENGQPAGSGRFMVTAILDDKRSGYTPVGVVHSARAIGEGLYELALELPRSLKSARLFQIVYEHDHGGGVLHKGATIVGVGAADD